MRETQTEEQKIEAIEAIEAMYEVVEKSFTEAFTEMGKTIAGLADVLRETDQ